MQYNCQAQKKVLVEDRCSGNPRCLLQKQKGTSIFSPLKECITYGSKLLPQGSLTKLTVLTVHYPSDFIFKAHYVTSSTSCFQCHTPRSTRLCTYCDIQDNLNSRNQPTPALKTLDCTPGSVYIHFSGTSRIKTDPHAAKTPFNVTQLQAMSLAIVFAHLVHDSLRLQFLLNTK